MALHCLLFIFALASAQLSEEERVALWRQKNTWPPSWQPESSQLARHNAERELEIMNLPSSSERWENWIQFTQHRMVPKFTERGFAVVDMPRDVFETLRAEVEKGLANWDKLPRDIVDKILFHPPGMESTFYDIRALSQPMFERLSSLHSDWAGGMKLQGTAFYGLRFYRNGSSLAMHYDRVETHVISSIMHLGHEYDDDDEPWPIEIEDHDGVLHEVSLQPGEMLFYESSKCLHGRRKQLLGKYYVSVFIHFAPEDKSLWNYKHEDTILHVPPHWHEQTLTDEGPGGACLTVESRLPHGDSRRRLLSQMPQRTEL